MQGGIARAPSKRGGLLPFLSDAAGLLVALAGVANFAGRLVSGLTSPCDFTAYYLAGRAFASGQDYYRQETLEALAAGAGLVGDLGPFLYPPLFAALMAPLGALDYAAARLLWLALGVLSLLGSFLALRAALPLRLGRGWRGPALAVVVLFPPVFDDLLKGQVSAFLLLLLCGALLAHLRGRPASVGALAALAASIKLSPALFFVYFALRRDGRALGAGLLAGGGLALVSLFLAGPARHLAYLTQTLPFAGLQVGAAENVSLAGLLARLFDPNSLTPPLLPDPLLHAAAGAAALLGLAVFYGWSVRRAEAATDRGAGFALTLLLILLVGPSSQAYVLTLALLPLALVFARWRAVQPIDWRRFDLLLVALLLLSVPPHLRLDPQAAGNLGEVAVSLGALGTLAGALPTLGLLLLGWLVGTRPSRPRP